MSKQLLFLGKQSSTIVYASNQFSSFTKEEPYTILFSRLNDELVSSLFNFLFLTQKEGLTKMEMFCFDLRPKQFQLFASHQWKNLNYLSFCTIIVNLRKYVT